MTELERAIQNARRSSNIDTGRGLLGDNSGNLRQANTGRYWVREEMATNQYAPPVPLLLGENVQLPPLLNLAVLIGINRNQEKVIIGLDANSMTQQGINPAQTNASDPVMAGLIEQERLSPLFTQPDPDQSSWALYASVHPGKVVFGGTYNAFAGDRIDLSGEVPGAGNHLYTVVFWTIGNALEIASSTAQSTGTALDGTDIQEALDAGTVTSLPLWAFVLTNGDATLDATDSIDLRQLWSAGVGIDDSARFMIWRHLV